MKHPRMPTPEEELLAYDAAIAASHENLWDDQERGIVTPKPELTRLRTLRGVARLEAGQHGGALEDFTFVLMQVPDDVDALSNRGVAHRALGALELAIADYTRAIALGPDRPNAYQNRGNVYRQQERWAEAEADYAAAVAIAPGYTGARENLMAVRRAQGKPSEPS